MLTQKLFNTQLGGEDGIRNRRSQTGLSAAGGVRKQAASATTVMMCEDKHPSVRTQLREQKTVPCRMAAGAVTIPFALPALPKLQLNPSSGTARTCTSSDNLRMNHLA